MKLVNSTITYGGILFGALSVVGLVVGAYQIGLVAPLQAMSELYQSLLRTVLSPFEGLIGLLPFEIDEYWRNRVVIVGLFAGRYIARSEPWEALIAIPGAVYIALVLSSGLGVEYARVLSSIPLLGWLQPVFPELITLLMAGGMVYIGDRFKAKHLWVRAGRGAYVRSRAVFVDVAQILVGAALFLTMNAGLPFLGIG